MYSNNNIVPLRKGQRNRAAVVYSVDECGRDIALIPLTRGRCATAYVEDWEDIAAQYGECWCVQPDGKGHVYAATHVPGAGQKKGSRHMITMQRAITGAIPGDRVGFINGNTLDCRRDNLTFVGPYEPLQQAA